MTTRRHEHQERTKGVTNIDARSRAIAGAIATYLVGEAEEQLALNPSLSANEVVEMLRRRAAELGVPPTTNDVELGDCGYCRRPLGRTIGGQLTHLAPDGRLSNKGCRAASYDWRKGSEGGWNDDLSPNVYARRTA